MDYRKLTDADLVDFSKNVALQLTGHEVVGLDNLLQDDLALLFTPLNASFETSIESGVTKTAQKESAIAEKQSMRDLIIERLAMVRNYLVAAETPKSAYEICGFTFPKTPGAVVANDPTELSGEGTSNGVNSLRWKGNNKPGNVVYEIWRLHGDTAPWTLHATTKKQFHQDTPVTPGQVYNYKVRAVAATNVSNYSNVAVIYGAT
jgi:hypothetical protein